MEEAEEGEEEEEEGTDDKEKGDEKNRGEEEEGGEMVVIANRLEAVLVVVADVVVIVIVSISAPFFLSSSILSFSPSSFSGVTVGPCAPPFASGSASSCLAIARWLIIKLCEYACGDRKEENINNYEHFFGHFTSLV